MLIAPEFAPITFTVGFLERPLEEVADALRRWYAEAGIARTLRPYASGALAAALGELEPLGAPDFTRLWIATASPRWRTAYFDGFVNGTDAFPPISYLAERMGCHGLIVGTQPDSATCFGATHVALYGPAATEWLNLEWSVAARNDGGRWRFQRTGPLQPFEESETYARRRIRDRLPPELLLRYCRALDVPLDAAAFGPAHVLDVPTARASDGQRRETLATARARLGLAPAAAA
jgi:hypothetical protein